MSVIVLALIVYGLRHPIANLIQKIKNVPTLTPISTIPEPVVAQNEVVLSIDKDTDGDGILDWQETLLGTDPNIPNSKNDVPQEIRQLVQNSNTLVDTSDKLALKVYQRLKTDPKGDDIGQAIQAATSKELLDYADSIDQGLTTYSLDDLELVDNTPEAQSAYYEQMGSLLQTTNLDAVTLEQIYKKITTLENQIKASGYQIKLSQAIATMVTMPVPLRFSEIHVSILNAMTHMDRVLSKNTKESDPTDQYAWLLVFQKNWNVLAQSVSTLSAMTTD